MTLVMSVKEINVGVFLCFSKTPRRQGEAYVQVRRVSDGHFEVTDLEFGNDGDVYPLDLGFLKEVHGDVFILETERVRHALQQLRGKWERLLRESKANRILEQVELRRAALQGIQTHLERLPAAMSVA